MYDDLAKYAPALEALEPTLVFVDTDLAVDYGLYPARHLHKSVAHVADGKSERAENAILPLEQRVEIYGGRRPRGGAAGDEAAAAFEAKQRAVPGVGSDVLEHDINADLVRELAHDALEPVFAVVDYMIRAECERFRHLLVVSDCRDDDGADVLGKPDRRGAYARAARVHEYGFSGLELGVVKQHVLDRGECQWRTCSFCGRDSGRHRDRESSRKIVEIARESIDMEAHHAGDVLAEGLASPAAGL